LELVLELRNSLFKFRMLSIENPPISLFDGRQIKSGRNLLEVSTASIIFYFQS